MNELCEVENRNRPRSTSGARIINFNLVPHITINLNFISYFITNIHPVNVTSHFG